MNNVTYLFGAGASIGALPILKNMPSSMAEQIIFLKNKNQTLINDTNTKIIITDEETEYISDLEWLMTNCGKHASVDTFARKLFVNEKYSDFLKLKNCLSVYFLIEQLRNDIDSRYDAFLAALLETRTRMPKNIKILSWNYDMQFEMAYQLFTDELGLHNAQSKLGVFHKFNDNWRAGNEFGIYKINGSSIAYANDNSRNQYTYADTKGRELTINVLQGIFKSYIEFKKNPNKYINGLSFAWEKENNLINGNDIVSIAKKQTIDTNVLIIIGYSIPFFNRQIDRDLIRNMAKLRKVYFQSKEPLALIERFFSIRDDIDKSNLIPIEDCNQFYIPNEL